MTDVILYWYSEMFGEFLWKRVKNDFGMFCSNVLNMEMALILDIVKE